MEYRQLRREMKVLERRRDFLGQRISQRHTTHKIKNDEAYDRAEFNALGTALEVMNAALVLLPQPRTQGQIRPVRK